MAISSTVGSATGAACPWTAGNCLPDTAEVVCTAVQGMAGRALSSSNGQELGAGFHIRVLLHRSLRDHFTRAGGSEGASEEGDEEKDCEELHCVLWVVVLVLWC